MAKCSNKPLDFDVWQAGGGRGTPLSFRATCFTGYWAKAPSILKPSSDSSGTKERLEVNGHSFLGRIAVYKYLIQNTNAKLLLRPNDSLLWGPGFCGHFVWGYAALLDWQARSGRLSMAMGSHVMNSLLPPDTISTRSWWGYINFMFSISMLLGAVEAGVLDNGGKVEVTFVDAHSNYLVENDPVVQESIQLWKKFWLGGFTHFYESVQYLFGGVFLSEEERHAQMDVLYDEMNQDEWIAHCAIFQITAFSKNRTSQELLLDLSEPERKFAIGFCKIVNILSAVNIRTDLITTSENGVGYMPLRMVDNSMMEEINNAAPVSPIQQKRNTIVLNMHNLYALNDTTVKLVALIWRRVGLWWYPRKNAAVIFDTLTHGRGLVKMDAITTFAFFLLLPSSKIEYAAWIAIAYYYLSFRLLAVVGLFGAISIVLFVPFSRRNKLRAKDKTLLIML